LSFLASATDDHFRTDLVGQITQCAERFAPSNGWYVQTIIQVFELAGKMLMIMMMIVMMIMILLIKLMHTSFSKITSII